MARRPWRSATLVAALALATGCGGKDIGPPTQAELDRVAVRLDRVARLREPVALTVAGDGTTLLVGERSGRVRAIRNGQWIRCRCWT